MQSRRLPRTPAGFDQLPPRVMIRFRHATRRMEKALPLTLAYLSQLRTIGVERFEELSGDADSIGQGEVVGVCHQRRGENYFHSISIASNRVFPTFFSECVRVPECQLN